MNKLINILEDIFSKYYICSICLSRLFYNSYSKKINISLGKKLKKELKEFIIKNKKEKANIIIKNLYRNSKECILCKNLFFKIKKIILNIIYKTQFYEFNTFYIGIKVPSNLIKIEDEIRTKYGITTGDSLKSFFNKVLCRIISKKTGKKVDFINPDLKIIYEMQNDLIEIEPTSLFIYGRYIKNKRGIRQTREYCDYCKGAGCSECNYTGYSNVPSIENYILPIFKEKFSAEDSILHAAGREDIDVITINTGRPFVVEVKRPLKRNVELKKIEEEINKNAKGDVIVKGLRYVDRDVMKKIKVLSKYEEKTYLLRVKFEKPVNKQILDFIVSQLNNRVIHQRTPTRVLYRRKDIVRYKMVYSVEYNQIDKQIVEFKINCQGGLYVKELAHGDNNRTNPSIASLAKMNVEVLSLDVISISPDLEKKLNLY